MYLSFIVGKLELFNSLSGLKVSGGEDGRDVCNALLVLDCRFLSSGHREVALLP